MLFTRLSCVLRLLRFVVDVTFVFQVMKLNRQDSSGSIVVHRCISIN